MKVFICLAKNGDIISVLPVIHHHAKMTDIKPVVIVSKQYAPLLERVPYVQLCVHNGPWTDVTGALRFAKRRFGDVTVLSTYGEGFHVEHRKSSFQLDAWERAGALALWDSLPLELDREEHMEFSRPTILFADHSQSSPFLQKDALCQLLRESFPQHDVVRLSEYRMRHLFDFLPWYDAADALVTVETAHLHLSAATKTPVFALATDQPSRWHGSCWSKRFKFFCRYSDYDARKDELMEAIKDTLAGRKEPEVLCLN